MSEGIGERLAAIRKALGETQKSMGERMEVGTNTWPSLERDGRLPKQEPLMKIAELGFSIDWLLTGEGTMMRGAAPAEQSASRNEEPTVTFTADAAFWREMAVFTYRVFQEEDVNLHKLKAEKFGEIVDAMVVSELEERSKPGWTPLSPEGDASTRNPSLLRRFVRLFIN